MQNTKYFFRGDEYASLCVIDTAGVLSLSLSLILILFLSLSVKCGKQTHFPKTFIFSEMKILKIRPASPSQASQVCNLFSSF
jgi:hypothetical protein